MSLFRRCTTRVAQTKRHRLKSALPHPWRYQARCPLPRSPEGPKGLFRHRLLRAYDDGVRTFLPPSHLAITKPAITRLTRQLNYNSSANRSSYGKVRAISWVAEQALDLGRPHLAVARIMPQSQNVGECFGESP